MISNNFCFYSLQLLLEEKVSLILFFQGILFILILCILYFIYYLVYREKSIKPKINQINLYQADLEKELNELHKELDTITDLIQTQTKKKKE
ncbi:MAG: hypothetical protein ACK5MD_03990 [Flavobacteriales bacterium]